jgi:hypothetical protein
VIYARLLYDNVFIHPTAILTASSIDPAFPIAWLRDQLRSKTWRSKLGYNVTAFNNKLDFKEAGVARVATLTVANYPTSALYAAQVQLAMNAAPGAVNTYVVTYDATTHLFTITRNTGAAAVILPFLTGANFGVSAHPDLGYLNLDFSGLTSYVAHFTSYHTREWIKADFGVGSTVGGGTSGVVLNHNLLATSESQITLQGNATDVWSAPTVSQLLEKDALHDPPQGVVAHYHTSQLSFPLRYWRFLIEDVGNADAFSEIGIAYFGQSFEPTVGYSINLANNPDELSAVDVAIQGAHYQDVRPMRNVWSLEWEEITEVDRAILEAWAEATPRGKNFFFAFNRASDPLDTIYCYRADALRRQYIGPAPSGGYWTLSVTLAEALG